MKIRERIAAINKELEKLAAQIDSASADEIEAISAEVEKLTKERSDLTAKMAEEAKKLFKTGTNVGTTRIEEVSESEIEERARVLKQGRAISLDNIDILHINHQGSNIKPSFNQVSQLVDLIPIIPLNGGESFSRAYMKSYGVAGYTGEGQDYSESEPVFGYAEINKSKLTVYTEISEEFEKLAPKYYLTEVYKNLSISLRKKLALEYLNGDGATGHLTGIFSSSATAIDSTKDMSISLINENTLDEIIFAYGGDEDLSMGVLILSKEDLRAFALVKEAKKRVYEIDYKNQTINGVPYVINSAITPLVKAKAGDYVMAYGSLSNYECYSFSPIEVMKSYDYKFRQGQVAFKASGFFGGNVISWNGFLRIKKAAEG